MDSMIRVEKNGKPFRVFFTINRERQDFENIRVRDGENKPLTIMHRDDIEALKDIIAQEIIVATGQLAAMYGDRLPPLQ